MPQLSRSVQFAYRSKNLLRLNHVMTAFNSKGRHEKLAITVHVLQNTYDFVIYVVALQRTAKKWTKIQNALAEPLFCSVNLLFGDVLVSPLWFAKTPYSPARLEQAGLVSSLLYGTWALNFYQT